ARCRGARCVCTASYGGWHVAATIKFELVTLSGVKYSEDVYEVLLPTLSGQIGVLPGHMPLISAATQGLISVRKASNLPDDMMENFATNGGVIEVENNTLRVLVDEA